MEQKQIVQDLDKLDSQIVETTNRSLYSLHQTQELSKTILHELDGQGDQIATITGGVKHISNLQDNADTYLRSISSVLGGAVNKLYEINPVPNLVRILRNAYDPNKRTRLDLNQENNNIILTEIAQTQDLDKALDSMSNMLDNLKKDAIQMGDEINRHNIMLEHLSDCVDDTRHRMQNQTNFIGTLK